MNKTLTAALSFIFGAAVGAGGAYVLTKKSLEKRYSKKAEDEIESVRQAYTRMQKDLAEKNKSEKERIWNEWSEEIEKNGYSAEGTDNHGELPKNDIPVQEQAPVLKQYVAPQPAVPFEDTKDIYFVTPEQFGEYDDYNTVNLTYYTNDIFTDEQDEPIENPEDLLSQTIVTLISDPEADYTERYVRDDIHKIDYEVYIADCPFLET